MDIIRVMGGLGNQLQQYALYRKFLAMGKEVRLDISWFTNAQVQDSVLAKRDLELKLFENLEMQTAAPEEIRAVLGRLYEEPEGFATKLRRKVKPDSNPVFTESGMYHPEIFQMEQKYLVGYWACDKYYADVMEDIRKQLRFPVSSREENRRLMEELQKPGQVSVSVHIRRGDYLDSANRDLFGGICTDAYYKTAITYMKERFPGAVFYLFSDDPDYVRAQYQGEEYHVVDWNHGTDSFYDMQLMSQCTHNICANSTFSFWGARLNENPAKIRIRPSIHKNTQVCIPEEMKELWKGWTLITPQGEIL